MADHGVTLQRLQGCVRGLRTPAHVPFPPDQRPNRYQRVLASEWCAELLRVVAGCEQRLAVELLGDERGQFEYG